MTVCGLAVRVTKGGGGRVMSSSTRTHSTLPSPPPLPLTHTPHPPPIAAASTTASASHSPPPHSHTHTHSLTHTHPPPHRSREHDRFWILAAHPEINLLAAGHDSGIIVFKLERERPAHSLHGSKLFYVKDRYLRLYDLASRRSTPLLALKRPSGSTLNAAPRHLGYNPAENAVLLTSTAEGGSYELYSEGGRGGGRRGGV